MADGVNLDKQAIRRRFERAASSYDGNSPVQRSLAERLVEAIESEAPGRDAPECEPSSILELGCGTGHLTELLQRRFPQARIEAVDFAPAMVARARERVPEARFLVRDIEELAHDLAQRLAEEPEPGSGRYDLIASSATFQWLADLQATLASLARTLRPESGRLHLSTFGPRTFWELDEVLAEAGEDRGLELRSAEKWETLLVGAGFHRIRAQSYEERFSYPDCATFLRSVKSSGAGYAPRRIAPSVLARAIRRYDERFASGAESGSERGSGVTATYEIVMLSAQR